MDEDALLEEPDKPQTFVVNPDTADNKEEATQHVRAFQRRNTQEADNRTEKEKPSGHNKNETYDLQRRNTQQVDNRTEKENPSSDNKDGTYHHEKRKTHIRKSKSLTRPDTNIISDMRYKRDRKVVGMKDGIFGSFNRSIRGRSVSRSTSYDPQGKPDNDPKRATIEEHEDAVRSSEESRWLVLMIMGNIAALKVMVIYLITLDTLLACGLSVGLTCYWYFHGDENEGWHGGGMDWVILGFAVVTPMSASISIAFRRREEALLDIAKIRSFSYQLYLAHCVWDWDTNGGRENCKNVDWLAHTDYVLAQLIGIGDELSRFLSLPTASRSRHRMTRAGRKEAARTVEVAYRLFHSLYTRRVTRLTLYAERLKAAGLSSGEISRIRQYERFIGESIEHLRMVKMYRSPQALRSFARIFTLLLPPFYAPTYAQIALDLNSLGVGIAFAIITSIGLTALFESIQVLEDPFVAFLTLDGIDVREEFEVLHWQQLVSTRDIIFPNAKTYPELGRAALDSFADTKVRRRSKPISEPSFSFGSAQEFGSTDEKDSFRPYSAEQETVTNDELGVPLSLNPQSLRMRTSSYVLMHDMVDAPSSTGGSISGSERKKRRILKPTG